MKNQPVCLTVLPWLRANLGKHCLGRLTGSDAKALAAAVQILALHAYDSDRTVLEAFAAVVRRMQPCSQELAYHAIAHTGNWNDRARIWGEAGLPEIIPHPARCAFE